MEKLETQTGAFTTDQHRKSELLVIQQNSAVIIHDYKAFVMSHHHPYIVNITFSNSLSLSREP